MTTITFDSNFGNFAYSATANVVEDGMHADTTRLLSKGIANEMYRAAGSHVQKAFEKDYPMVLSRDKDVANDAKGRRAIPYSDANAAKFTEVVNAKCAELAKDEGGPLISVVCTGEYIFGETDEKPTKEATELWVKVQGFAPAKFEASLTALGLDESYTDESGIIACKKYLQRVAREAKENAVKGLQA